MNRVTKESLQDNADDLEANILGSMRLKVNTTLKIVHTSQHQNYRLPVLDSELVWKMNNQKSKAFTLWQNQTLKIFFSKECNCCGQHIWWDDEKCVSLMCDYEIGKKHIYHFIQHMQFSCCYQKHGFRVYIGEGTQDNDIIVSSAMGMPPLFRSSNWTTPNLHLVPHQTIKVWQVLWCYATSLSCIH